MDAVYSLPWECMAVAERKIVLFFLRKVQTPIALKAGGLVPVGVKTMAAVSHVLQSSLIYTRLYLCRPSECMYL